MALFSLLNRLVDLLVSPLSGIGPLVQLIALSLVSTVLLLALFKRVSNQERIKYHKNRIIGNFLEIAIYRDQFRRALLCQAEAMKHNLLYLGAISSPLLLLMPPMILVCLQLEYRLGYQPLRPGDSFIIEASLDTPGQEREALTDGITITTSNTITLETPALRIPKSGQVFWQARVGGAGAPNFIAITLPGTGETVRKELAVNTLTSRFSPEKRKITGLGDILASGEESIPQASRLKAVRVSYLPAEYPFFHWTLSPIIYYFILTLIFGLLIKPFIKVAI